MATMVKAIKNEIKWISWSVFNNDIKVVYTTSEQTIKRKLLVWQWCIGQRSVMIFKLQIAIKTLHKEWIPDLKTKRNIIANKLLRRLHKITFSNDEKIKGTLHHRISNL